jgi:hypothetical protein
MLICGAAAAVKPARCHQMRGTTVTFVYKKLSLVGRKVVVGQRANTADEAQVFFIGLQARQTDSGGLREGGGTIS